MGKAGERKRSAAGRKELGRVFEGEPVVDSKDGIDNLVYMVIDPKKTIVITPAIIQHVRKLAGLGLTINQIHDYYGLSDKQWLKLRKKHPMLELAMKQGKAVNCEWAAGKLRHKMEQGNLGAIIFYLKTQAGWREKEYNIPNGPSGDGELPKVPSIVLTVNDPIEAARIYQQVMTNS